MATPEVVENPSWYVDIGASHHVSNSQQNLAHKQDCNDMKSLVVANGSKIDISHVGNAKLKLVTNNKVSIFFLLLWLFCEEQANK